MQEGGSWQEVLRALCALEAVISQGSSAACGEIAVHFQVSVPSRQSMQWVWLAQAWLYVTEHARESGTAPSLTVHAFDKVPGDLPPAPSRQHSPHSQAPVVAQHRSMMAPGYMAPCADDCLHAIAVETAEKPFSTHPCISGSKHTGAAILTKSYLLTAGAACACVADQSNACKFAKVA